jgi:hypothetical protein
MMFKKPQQEVVEEIMKRAQGAAYSSVYNDYNTKNIIVHHQPIQPEVSQNAMASMVANAVAMAMRASFEEMIKQIYTDREFEEDIGLREKNATQR